ncbi:MAG: DNA repair protein RecO [Clostridia bacterium]|nr:DNA repair protein RecO [Clostridia bacterium]
MVTQIKALVLGDIVWGENDKLLTVLTAEYGRMCVVLKGGSSLKSKVAGACLPFAYTEMTLAEKGGRPWVREATEIRGFHGIRKELESTALALYVLDVLTEVCLEDGEESEMLQLALNTLHAIENKLKPLGQIKAAFELRTAAACGFSPDLVACNTCGEDKSQFMYLDVMDGVMTCRECRQRHIQEPPAEGHTSIVLMLDRPILDAMRLISYSPPKRFLSFQLPDGDSRLFCSYCEKYLLNHIDRGFASLEFFHSLEGL